MLELVLALPILLFIMALIYNYGVVAAWKVRENSVARLAVWQTRWPRTGATDPWPSYWPTSATMTATDQGNVQGMDDSRIDLPVARGPLPGATVDKELLDETRGLRLGSAEITRQFVYLKKLGSFTKDASNWLVDDKWQYQRMNNLQTGNPLPDNWQRRIPVIYALAQAPASLMSSYINSALAIANAAFAAQLRPLDNDPDFAYYGMLFGWGGPPDFQPRFRQLCTTDRMRTDQSVKNLINRIQGGREGRRRIPSTAEVMAQAFIGLYQRALAAFQGILKANPPAPPQMTALAQSQIPILQSNVAALPEGAAGHHCDGRDAGQPVGPFCRNGLMRETSRKRGVYLSFDRLCHSRQEGPTPPKDPPSLGRLARRISRWTTNCLLTAMLLVIALGFGREVLHWWHDDAPPRPAASAGSSAAPGQPLAGRGLDSQVLAFGNQNWSIRRQEFSGSQAEVPAALLAFCRTAISNARPRGDAADAAEQDMLKRLAAEKPAAEEPGRWRLYQWSAGSPIVVGIRSTQPGTNLAEPPYRVVIWGMAVPTRANAWSLYVFQPGTAGSGAEQSNIEVPLPPGGRRLAMVRTADGSSITAFAADDDLGDSCRKFYDRWFADHGWKAADPWRRSPAAGRPASSRRPRARMPSTSAWESIQRANRRGL